MTMFNSVAMSAVRLGELEEQVIATTREMKEMVVETDKHEKIKSKTMAEE